jgi:hypothetical protein
MRKVLIVAYLFSAFSLHAIDLISDVGFTAGYLYNTESPKGFYIGIAGVDGSWTFAEGNDGFFNNR